MMNRTECSHRLWKLLLTVIVVCGLLPEVMAKVAPGNRELSRQLAAECMVLLKNDREALPLQPNDRVALFGAGQIDFVKGGWGSGNVNVDRVVNLLDGLQEMEKQGLLKIAPTLAAAYRADSKLKLTAEMVKQARGEAEKALVVISRNSGEGSDRKPHPGDFYLSEDEVEMLRLVSEGGFERIIAVLNVGGVIDCRWVKTYPIDAVLNVWQPEMEGGLAAADALTGRADPSGRLTATWAGNWEDYPSSRSFFESRDFVLYEEDIFVGYRYFETFDPAGEKICFPFGFGLSYTAFSVKPVAAEVKDGMIHVTVAVTNTGKRPGRQVVQFYYSAPQGKLGRPAKELAAFAKTGMLAPGATEKLTVSFAVADMAAYDDTGCTGQKACWVLEPGSYKILAGTSVRDLLPEPVLTLEQPELKVVEKAATRIPPTKLPRRLMANGQYQELPAEPDAAPAPAPEAFSLKADEAVEIEAEAYQRRGGPGRVEAFMDEFGYGRCLAAMDKDTWIAYQLDVEKPGKYVIRFRMASGHKFNPDLMDILVNGERADVKVAMPQTGDGGRGQWHNFLYLEPVFVELPAGRVELKFQGKGAFANIDRFFIAQAETDAALFAERVKQQETARMTQLVALAKHRKRPDVKKVMFREVAADPSRLDAFIDQLSDMDLAELAGGFNALVPGGTGRIGVREDLGCPGVETCDGPAGVRLREHTTAWPCSTALASSWDVDMARRLGKGVAAELLLNGTDVWLAPGMNIHRNPMCGRNFEYYSEDPLLSGKIAAALTRSIQEESIGVTLKHFAFNNKEENRNACDSRLSERAAREIYLKGFEIAVKEADPWCIMSSYNFINGCETSESWDLLTGILRQEWGYRGLVMTDWGNNSKHPRELAAGNNVKMHYGLPKQLVLAMDKGVLTRKQLEDNARIVLELVLRSDVIRRKGAAAAK